MQIFSSYVHNIQLYARTPKNNTCLRMIYKYVMIFNYIWGINTRRDKESFDLREKKERRGSKSK